MKHEISQFSGQASADFPRSWAKRRVPRSWRCATAAIGLSAALGLGAAMIARLVVPEMWYVAIALLAALLFSPLAYLQGRRVQCLLELSQTDALTGVGNRRLLQTRLQQEMARYLRGQRPFCLLLVDVDHLKEINDQTGHRAGDEVLRQVARILLQCTRLSDVVGRYGGDEFMVILFDTSEAAGLALANRIVDETRRFSSCHPGLPRLSLSVGISAATTADTDVPSLLDAADRAMYAAKRSGGACAVSSGADRRYLSGITAA